MCTQVHDQGPYAHIWDLNEQIKILTSTNPDPDHAPDEAIMILTTPLTALLIRSNFYIFQSKMDSTNPDPYLDRDHAPDQSEFKYNGYKRLSFERSD